MNSLAIKFKIVVCHGKNVGSHMRKTNGMDAFAKFGSTKHVYLSNNYLKGKAGIHGILWTHQSNCYYSLIIGLASKFKKSRASEGSLH